MMTLRRLPKWRALATELIPAEALAITATSSRSAPMKRAKAVRAFSYSSTQRSQGEPCSCQERIWAWSEASTASLSAPCEQEFKKILFLKMGNCARISSIFGDKIFGTTSDAHIVALDARSGKLAWDTQVADHNLGYGYTSGPIVVRGKVIAGIAGCNHYKEDVCFISALDAETGKQVWRTSTVARPGEPGGDTWGDLPLTFRAGGDAWIPGSYDQDTNTVYWGTAQAKPWARAARGTDGERAGNSRLHEISAAEIHDPLPTAEEAEPGPGAPVRPRAARGAWFTL